MRDRESERDRDEDILLKDAYFGPHFNIRENGNRNKKNEGNR